MRVLYQSINPPPPSPRPHRSSSPRFISHIHHTFHSSCSTVASYIYSKCKRADIVCLPCTIFVCAENLQSNTNLNRHMRKFYLHASLWRLHILYIRLVWNNSTIWLRNSFAFGSGVVVIIISPDAIVIVNCNWVMEWKRRKNTLFEPTKKMERIIWAEKSFIFQTTTEAKRDKEKKHQMFKVHLLSMSFGLQAEQISRLARAIFAANMLEYAKSTL